MTIRGPLFSVPPLPKGRDPDQWTHTYTWGLLGKDKLPFRQLDWPPPPPPLPPPNLSAVGWYNRNLVGQDKLPIRQLDWPVPRGAQLGDGSFIQPANLKLLIPPAGTLPLTTFAQYDWPLPQADRWPYRAVLDKPSYLAYEFLDTFYGAPGQVPQYDYPLPARLLNPNVSYVWPSPLELLQSPPATPLGQPFNQHVWPTPQVRWLWH